jgi:hypothetical protein
MLWEKFAEGTLIEGSRSARQNQVRAEIASSQKTKFPQSMINWAGVHEGFNNFFSRKVDSAHTWHLIRTGWLQLLISHSSFLTTPLSTSLRAGQFSWSLPMQDRKLIAWSPHGKLGQTQTQSTVVRWLYLISSASELSANLI